jgi:hypothetical protein
MSTRASADFFPSCKLFQKKQFFTLIQLILPHNFHSITLAQKNSWHDEIEPLQAKDRL